MAWAEGALPDNRSTITGRAEAEADAVKEAGLDLESDPWSAAWSLEDRDAELPVSGGNLDVTPLSTVVGVDSRAATAGGIEPAATNGGTHPITGLVGDHGTGARRRGGGTAAEVDDLPSDDAVACELARRIPTSCREREPDKTEPGQCLRASAACQARYGERG